VLSLPYADPDVVAAVRHGEGQQVQEAQAYGQALTQRILSHVLTGWAWPPDGMISLSTIDALFAGGITDAVLSGANLPPIEGQPAETPNAHVPVVGRDGTLDGVLTDPTLSAVVDHGATGDSGLALQRYLSETLMIQAESPNDRRSIVIAPQRRWDPPAGYATALLQDTGRVPWLRPATLQRAISAPVDTELARTLRYPRSAARAQLSRSYLRSVAQVDGSLEAVNSILLRPTAVGQNPAKETIWAALSSAWRDHGRAAAAYLARLRSAVTDTVAQVHIASKTMSLVTLTSHSGAVPITVANDMDQPVRVRVALDAGRRLSVTGAGNSTRTIQPHERVAVDVRATANTSGTFPLIVRLLTPTGRPYGSPVRLFVRSTAYGALALLITGGALAVLFAAVVTRLVRRGLAARRASTGD
jgi:hypothetical protein